MYVNPGDSLAKMAIARLEGWLTRAVTRVVTRMVTRAAVTEQ